MREHDDSVPPYTKRKDYSRSLVVFRTSFSTGSLWLLRGHRACTGAPLSGCPPAFAIFFALALHGLSYVEGEPYPGFEVVVTSSLYYTAFILAIGYFYVLVAWLGYRAAGALGCFKDAAV